MVQENWVYKAKTKS